MKNIYTVSDFHIGDMVIVKNNILHTNSKIGSVENITICPPRICVRHNATEVKIYKPEELKNITGSRNDWEK